VRESWRRKRSHGNGCGEEQAQAYRNDKPESRKAKVLHQLEFRENRQFD